MSDVRLQREDQMYVHGLRNDLPIAVNIAKGQSQNIFFQNDTLSRFCSDLL